MSLASPTGKALTTIKNTRRHAKQYLDTGFEADPVIRDKNYRGLIAEEQALLALPEKFKELIHDEHELLDLLDEAHATHDRYLAEHPEAFSGVDPMRNEPRLDTDAYRKALQNPDAFEGHDGED